MKKMSIMQYVHALAIMALLVYYEVYKMYPHEPIVSFPVVNFFVLLLLIVLFIFRMDFNYKNPITQIFFCLEMLILFISFEHHFIYHDPSLIRCVILSLPLFLFLFSYNFANNDSDNMPTIVFFIIIFLSTIFIFSNKTNVEEMLRAEAGSYCVLYFLPFAFCLKNKFLRNTAITVCIISMLLSFKRGGLISLLCGLFVFSIIRVFEIEDGSKKIKNIFLMVLFFAILIGGIYIFNDYFEDFLFYRFSVIESGGGSGRNEIYLHVIDMITNSSWPELFIGHGWNSVLRDNYLGFSAHNDFLECIYDVGLVAFCVYILLYVKLFFYSLYLIKRKSFFAAPFASSAAIFLSSSLVSHILLYVYFFSIFSFFWGYIIASVDKTSCGKNLLKKS